MRDASVSASHPRRGTRKHEHLCDQRVPISRISDNAVGVLRRTLDDGRGARSRRPLRLGDRFPRIHPAASVSAIFGASALLTTIIMPNGLQDVKALCVITQVLHNPSQKPDFGISVFRS